MTTTNFKTNNKDLGEIFYARTNVDPQINFNTNYIIHNTNQNTNIDLKELFYPYIHGNKAQLTNFKTNNTDLNELFQNINIPPILQYTISDQTKYTVVTNNNNTQFTFVFADYMDTPSTTNPVIGTKSTNNSITFTQEVTAIITIIGGGGGGGSNLGNTNGGGGGQGGNLHRFKHTIIENETISISTGVSGNSGIVETGGYGGTSTVTISQTIHSSLGGAGGAFPDYWSDSGGSGGSGSGNGGNGGIGGGNYDGENGFIGKNVNSIFDNSIVWYFGGGGGGGSRAAEGGGSKGGQGGGGSGGDKQSGNDNLEYNGPNGIYYPKEPASGTNYQSGYPGTGGGGAGGNGDWNQNLNPGGNGGSGIIIIQISL